MLLFSGKVKGVRKYEDTNRKTGEIITVFYLGLENPRRGGYDGEMQITEFHITKKQQESGLVDFYSGLVGKVVQVEVFNQVRAYSSRGGDARYAEKWYLAGDGSPVMQDGKVLKAVA